MRPHDFLLCLALVASSPLAAEDTAQDDPLKGRFSILRSGAPIPIQASPLYSAVLMPDTKEDKGLATPPEGLELDPRGNRPDLIERGLTLFRVPNTVAPRGLDKPPQTDAWQAALGSGLPVQPVFEHGAALRIPSDEVLVGFDPSTTLEDAKRLLSSTWDDLDAQELREFRPGTFVCKLRKATTGRVFEASRMLLEVAGVRWAEPSFINIHLETPGDAPDDRVQFRLPSSLTQRHLLESNFVTIKVNTLHHDPAGDVWQVAVDGHFEDDIDKWVAAREAGAGRILPVVVKDRQHGGKRSVYMSGRGLGANTPPDPYLEGAGSYLVGPTFNLASHAETYVELWFWARFEDPSTEPRQVYDFGRVLLYDVGSEEYVYEHPIAPVGPTGDLTQGPGTDSGWRKLMFRIPPEHLASPLQVHVNFHSDELDGAEGLYVDDIRVLYKAGPDAAAAWSPGLTDKDVIVALLDDGVERNHPDLAFWEPNKDADLSDDALFPGEPVAAEDRHGTACAGVLGALASNGGVVGVAPGALLLPLHRGVDDISIVRAIDAAVRHGAQVLVIPWGWTGAAPEVITRAIADAIGAGMTVVAAAGDGVHRPYSDTIDYPCSLSDSTALICVGASSIAGEPKGFASADGQYWWRSAESSTGPDLLAPGTWLRATDRRGRLGYNAGSQSPGADWTDGFSGTGASACYVGGVAALMVSHDPPLEPAQVKQMIVSTGATLPTSTGRLSELRLVTPKAAVRAAIESAEKRERAAAHEAEATAD